MSDEELTSYWNAYRRTVEHARLHEEEAETLQQAFAAVFNEARRARKAETRMREALRAVPEDEHTLSCPAGDDDCAECDCFRGLVTAALEWKP